MKTQIILSDELKAKRYIQRIPPYNPIKGLGYKSNINKTDGLSEYQAAFRKYPFHPPRQCIYPVQNKKDYLDSIKFLTTYKKDFVRHNGEDVKGESFKPEHQYHPSTSKFVGSTIYQMSYVNFDAETLKKCHRDPIRPSDPRKPIQGPHVPLTKKEVENIETTPATVEKATENQTTAEEKSPNTTGESKEQPVTYNKKITITKTTPGSKSKIQYSPFQAITTFMADYPVHPYAPRQAICKPPPSNNHYNDDAPFDGRTTQSIAYKVWPVAPPEKPKWAIKPEYKRLTGGMPFDSTYMFDFKDPGAMTRTLPITPTHGSDIIKHVNGDGDRDCNTTYQVNFLEWSGAKPAQTFHQKQVYVPPDKDMDCQSTQRAHFKGEQCERSQICRKVSEHRHMNKDKRMYFATTYRETYRDNRPKSSPATFNVPTSFQLRTIQVKRKEPEKDPLNDSGVSDL